MQEKLLTAVRDAGATQVVLLGGVQYSNALSGWLAQSRPTPPATWRRPGTSTTSTAAPAPAATTARRRGWRRRYPSSPPRSCATDHAHAFIDTLMGWLDARDQSYLAWTWDAWGSNLDSIPPTKPARRPRATARATRITSRGGHDRSRARHGGAARSRCAGLRRQHLPRALRLPIGQPCLPLDTHPDVTLCCAAAQSCSGSCCGNDQLRGWIVEFTTPQAEPDGGCAFDACAPPPDCAPFCPGP